MPHVICCTFFCVGGLGRAKLATTTCASRSDMMIGRVRLQLHICIMPVRFGLGGGESTNVMCWRCSLMLPLTRSCLYALKTVTSNSCRLQQNLGCEVCSAATAGHLGKDVQVKMKFFRLLQRVGGKNSTNVNSSKLMHCKHHAKYKSAKSGQQTKPWKC